MIHNKIEIPSTESFIYTVISKTECADHNTSEGFPCYAIPSTIFETTYAGVCDSRARRAGMVGKVTATSTRTNSGKR